MATRSIAAVIVALTLAACGGGADATTEVDDTAVDGYASAVASHDGAWGRARPQMRSARPCQQRRRAAGGEIPTEIADLVADTEAAAADYSAAYEAWEATECANPLNSQCGAEDRSGMDVVTPRPRKCETAPAVRSLPLEDGVGDDDDH